MKINLENKQDLGASTLRQIIYRQGDNISPKLFTATLESIFRRLNWENKGVKIDGEFLTNLRFADKLLCTETPQELQQMLLELPDESRRMGLKMNIA